MAEITPRQQANRDQLDATIRDLLDELIDTSGTNAGAVVIELWKMEVPGLLHGDRAALTKLLLAEAVARLARQR